MSYKKLKKKIDKITEAYGRLEEAVVSLETYSYRYNIKIVRMPTLSDQENIDETVNIYLTLFHKMESTDITINS